MITFRFKEFSVSVGVRWVGPGDDYPPHEAYNQQKSK